jgi:hypothetical protein
MIAVDEKIDRAADKLRRFAQRAAAEGGFAAKLAQPLADDAELLRKLKPSLIRARARGQAPTNAKPAHGTVPPPSAPSDPRPAPLRRLENPNPWLVVGAALATGVVLAKVIDWRGRAHRR